MPVPFRRLPSGTILVDVAKPAGEQRVVLYARVSSHDQRTDLDRQVSGPTGWARAKGLDVGQPRSVRAWMARARSWPGCQTRLPR